LVPLLGNQLIETLVAFFSAPLRLQQREQPSRSSGEISFP
jgi:hypothetical protein